jgi:hypothetical protein
MNLVGRSGFRLETRPRHVDPDAFPLFLAAFLGSCFKCILSLQVGLAVQRPRFQIAHAQLVMQKIVYARSTIANAELLLQDALNVTPAQAAYAVLGLGSRS